MKEEIAQLQKDIAHITQLMTERAKKDQEFDVHALAEKLASVQQELQEKKIEFAKGAGSASTMGKKELETRMDELFIAKMLCTDVDTKQFNPAAYAKIASNPVYTEAIKAAATFDGVDGMTTTGTGTGAEFIPKGFSSTLHEEIWLALEIGNLFGRIPMPFSDYTLPFDPSRIIVRAGGEGKSVTKDKPTTGKLTFEAKKIMSIVEMTDEFEQDSLVPALNFIRNKLINGFALGHETMCLNGDTGTAIYSSAFGASSEDCRKLVKGIRADAMGTSTTLDGADVTPANAGITQDHLREMRELMDKYGKNPSDLAYIVNMADYFKILRFTDYQQLYSYGQNAVILKGELGRLDNIPIIVTELLPKPGRAADASDLLGGLNATGVYDGTTYTKGTAVLVNKNGYLWGDRTEFALELWRNPLSQTTNLIGSQRLAFRKIASDDAKTCSVMYNY